MNKTPVLGAIVMITLITAATVAASILPQSAFAPISTDNVPSLRGDFSGIDPGPTERRAPIATSGDNTYIAWWTNRTGNDEVLFRATTDSGATFADKINLSNSTAAESQDVEIAADGDNVIVTWWERNATSNEPVLRISTDNGETFGPILKLASNGTIGQEG